MSQRRISQHGTFHITTNSKNKQPWLTFPGVPQMLIDNLVMTRNITQSKVCAFCILPDHMHMIVVPGAKGISEFVRSFKTNSSRDVGLLLGKKYIDERGGEINRDRGGNINNHRGGHGTSAAFALGEIFSGWQHSFHDELIGSGKQRTAAIGYVQGNAVKHGYVEDVMDWSWSSLHFQNRMDVFDVWLD